MIRACLNLSDIDETEDQELINTFCSVAENDNTNMMYAYVGTDSYEHQYLAKYLNVHTRNTPVLCGVKWEVAYGMMRYEYDGDASKITQDDIIDFKTRFLSGALERHFYDDQADTWYHLKDPVTIIYDEYQNVVMNPDNDVLVYYFSTNIEDKSKATYYHNHIKQVQEMVGRPDHLIIGRYDWHKAPPVTSHQSNLDSIMLYPKNNKEKGIKYDGEISVESIKDWLAKHSTVYQDMFVKVEDL